MSATSETQTKAAADAGATTRQEPAWSRWAGWWPERLGVVLAMLGLLYAMLEGFHVRTWQAAASDMKTVYAAASLFAHGRPAYGFGDLAEVFAAGHVVAPVSWYAHAPVYPPFTLAVLAPLTLLPMVTAIYCWLGVCLALSAAAAYALMREAGQRLGLNRAWRFALLGLFAASPLLSAGLELGNVSVAVSALSLLAVLGDPARQPRRDLWWRAVALALALLLKPHLALWFAIGLLLLPERRGRLIAWRGIGLAAAFTLLSLGLAALLSPAGSQIGGYRAMLQAEIGSGSMAPANHELIGVPAQITALGSLMGYTLGQPRTASILSWAIVLLLAGTLAWTTRRVTRPETRLLMLGAWCALGLIATYHRAADGTALYVLLPWALLRLRARWWDPVVWTGLVCYIVMSCELTWEYWEAMELRPGMWHLARLVLYRQASLGAAGLALLLVAAAVVLRQKPLALTTASPNAQT